MLVAGLSSLSILDHHSCAEDSQPGQTPARASKRLLQTERRQPARHDPPIAESGTHTHDLEARHSMPAHAQTGWVALIGRTRRVPRFCFGTVSAVSMPVDI